MDRYICHVCGYPSLDEPPYGLNGDLASFNICSCCGVEFGYEDCQIKSYEKFQNEWISSGTKWFAEELRPNNWNFEDQLKNLKKIPNKLLPNHLK